MKTPMYDYMFSLVNSLPFDRERHIYTRGMVNVVRKNINDSRIFKIPHILSQMFLLTDPIKTHLLPFETVFLEQFTKVDKGIIKGIYLYQLKDNEKNKLINPYEDVIYVYSNLEINGLKTSILFLMSKGQKENRGLLVLEAIPENIINNQKGVEHEIQKIVYNFLCFVNSPDIEYITKIDTKRETEIRTRKGKPPRPTMAIIKLTDPLKRYIYKQKSGIKMIYSHRFWVRGHWRTLRNKKYGQNVGKKLWIKPYVKGDGLLIPKKYELVGGS